MADKKQPIGNVKVKANYDFSGGESLLLWGVKFNKQGKDYVAELSEGDAQALLDAGRVTKL